MTDPTLGAALRGAVDLSSLRNRPAAAAQATGRQDDDLAAVPIKLVDVLAQAPRDARRVEFRLDDDAPTDDVQPARETQHRGDLGLAATGLGNFEPAQLVLHRCGHGHRAMVPSLGADCRTEGGLERLSR